MKVKIFDILKLLQKRENRRFVFLIFLLLITGLLEIIGIASILPFIQVVANPDLVENSYFFSAAYGFFQFSSYKGFVVFLGFASIGLIVFSSLMKILNEWYKLKFIWDVTNRMSVGLFGFYISNQYSFFLDKNTKDLSSLVISEVNYVSKGVIASLLSFIGKALVAIVILVMLLVVNYQIALVMFIVLFLAYFFIYQAQRKKLAVLGEKRIQTNAARYRSLIELFEGIKTIKLYGKESVFYGSYDKASKVFTDIQPQYQISLAMPRFVLEVVAFGSIVGVILYLYLIYGSIQDIVPTLSLYAVAGYKLLPALQNAYVALGNIRHNWPTLEKLFEPLMQIKNKNISPVGGVKKEILLEQNLQLIDIEFSYDQSTTLVLNGINLDISKGQTIALVGSTGSGKTTLVDVVSGLLFPQSGKIILDGISLKKEDFKLWRDNIAYVPQEVFLFDGTVMQNITFEISGDEDQNYGKVERAASLAEIHDFISKLPYGYQTEIGEKGVRLSGGQRQRIGLARALLREPSLLILDEATSSLDTITEKSIVDALDNLPRKMTTILIAHRLSTVKRADKIYILENGRIKESGTYEELLAKSATFKEMVHPS